MGSPNVGPTCASAFNGGLFVCLQLTEQTFQASCVQIETKFLSQTIKSDQPHAAKRKEKATA
eukprot:787844-Amphidinium_carterae.1